MDCPKCNNTIPTTATFCAYCGMEIIPQQRRSDTQWSSFRRFVIGGGFVLLFMSVIGYGSRLLQVANISPVETKTPSPSPTQVADIPTTAPTSTTYSLSCVVPDVVGLDERAARNAITTLGLQPIKSVEYSVNIVEDTVLSQAPPAGSKFDPCQGSVTFTVSLGPTPTPVLPTETPREPTSRYTVRMFNVDDVATLYINGQVAYKAKWGHSGTEPNWNYFGHKWGDSGEIDITSLLNPGDNTLHFELWNEAVCCGVSVSIEVKEDGKLIFSDAFSMQDSSEGIKYDKTINITVK